MSVTQIPHCVAKAAISIDASHEKSPGPFSVCMKITDLTIDSRGDLRASEAATEAVLALDDEKTPGVSQIPNETGPAPGYEGVSSSFQDTTGVYLAQGNDKATELFKTTTKALGDENNSNVFDVTMEVSSARGDGSVYNISQTLTEAGLTLDNEEAFSISQIPTDPIAPVLEDEKANSVEVTETSSKILDVILEYSLNKFDTTKERHAAGTPKFLSVISAFVRKGKQVQMCLPAFPFKSANKVYKVLGTLPDKAEELALGRLNSMCTCIGGFYRPGAKLTIISDGLVYNDLLSISDQHTWAYGEALRSMAAEKNFVHIGFSRLQDLVTFPGMPDNLQETSYVANATNFRRFLLNKHGKDDINIEHEISTNPDTLMTYRGYCRFLESDLQYIFVTGKGRTNNGYKRDVKYLAKQMLIRGYAFAAAVKASFPDYLRLSIHQSTGEHKVSMSLLNTKTGFTSPWHCSVALMADGEWISAPMGDFKADPLLEIVHEDGRPSYFREVVRKRPYLNGNKGFGSNQQAIKA